MDKRAEEFRKKVMDYVEKRLKDDLSAEEIMALAKLTESIRKN